jgi:hypothetical protein
MIAAIPGNSRSRRAVYFGCACAFVAFLLYSAPHRVHHFFEPIAGSHQPESGNHTHDREPSPRPNGGSDCVFQFAANRCLLSLNAPAAQSAPALLVATIPVRTSARILSNPRRKVFTIRAPPISPRISPQL